MKIDVSNGELVDKVTILSIKLNKFVSREKRQNVQKEFQLLYQSMLAIGISEETSEYKDLLKVNLALWEIEDQIRSKEARKEFDNEFIRLARRVYFENDKRSEIKRKINIATDSKLIEEKEYVEYR
jgi:hypothetical protein